MRQRRLHGEEGGVEVVAHHGAEGLGRRAAERRRARDAGIGEDDVDLAETRDAGRDGRLDRRGVGAVGLHGERLAAEFGLCRVERLLVAPGDDHLGALGEEELRGGEADAAGAARDERRLALEPHGRSPCSERGERA
jgi:hypothetical protein